MNALLSSGNREFLAAVDGAAYLFVRRSTPGRRALLRNHRHCTRDSIYFVYSAEKCFHLRGNCQSDSHGGGARRRREEREVNLLRSVITEERKKSEEEKQRSAHCAPPSFAVTKAFNSTMHPSKRTIAGSW